MRVPRGQKSSSTISKRFLPEGVAAALVTSALSRGEPEGRGGPPLPDLYLSVNIGVETSQSLVDLYSYFRDYLLADKGKELSKRDISDVFFGKSGANGAQMQEKKTGRKLENSVNDASFRASFDHFED